MAVAVAGAETVAVAETVTVAAAVTATVTVAESEAATKPAALISRDTSGRRVRRDRPLRRRGRA